MATSQRLTKIDATEADPGIEARSDAPLDTAHIGLGRRNVVFAREQQRDVHRHAREDRLLDRGNACAGARNLDEKIGALRTRMQLRSCLYGSRCVVGKQGRDLQRHPAVDTAGGVVDRPEQIGGLCYIFQREFEEQRLA